MEQKNSAQDDMLLPFEIDLSESCGDYDQMYRDVRWFAARVKDFTEQKLNYSNDDFYRLMQEVTPSKQLIDTSVVAREIAESLNDHESDSDSNRRIYDSWYDSFTMCMHIASLMNDKTPDELLSIRSMAYEKLYELHDKYYNSLDFATFANALNWYDHVIIGATFMLGETSETATDDWADNVKSKKADRRALYDNEYGGHLLYKDKIDFDSEPDEMRSSARYVTIGLEEDAEPSAKAFIDLKYLNDLQGELWRSNDTIALNWRKLADLSEQFKIWYQQNYGADEEPEVVDIDLENFKSTQVDWEVLPPGNLKDFAIEIVEGENERHSDKEVRIDPDRLKVLEEIRTQWGADKSFYAKGSLRRRTVKTDKTQRCPDQYIMLILQDYGDDGRIIEHAVAESPIAGPHAMYVFRQDVNPAVSWRHVMSVDKREARGMGARPLRHPAELDNGELVRLMSERVADLMIATPEEFLRIEFKGNRTSISKTLAIKAFASLQRDDATIGPRLKSAYTDTINGKLS